MSAAVSGSLRREGSKAVLIGAVIAGGALVLWLAFRCPLPFASALWQVGLEGNMFNTRYRVADGLELTGRLKGMTRAEVVGLLGPPPPTDKYEDHGLVYVLGPERGIISIDYEWLLVDFDSAGKVMATAVVSD